jgi:hypothetical protein
MPLPNRSRLNRAPKRSQLRSAEEDRARRARQENQAAADWTNEGALPEPEHQPVRRKKPKWTKVNVNDNDDSAYWLKAAVTRLREDRSCYGALNALSIAALRSGGEKDPDLLPAMPLRKEFIDRCIMGREFSTTGEQPDLLELDGLSAPRKKRKWGIKARRVSPEEIYARAVRLAEELADFQDQSGLVEDWRSSRWRGGDPQKGPWQCREALHLMFDEEEARGRAGVYFEYPYGGTVLPKKLWDRILVAMPPIRGICVRKEPRDIYVEEPFVRPLDLDGYRRGMK